MTSIRTLPAVLTKSFVLAVLHSVAARSLGWACLMLMALASRDLAAQPVVVNFQPGEVNKEVPMPRFASEILTTTLGHVCAWPTIDEVRSRISSMDAATLASSLGQMESSAKSSNYGLAMFAIMGQNSTYEFRGRPVPLPPPSQTKVTITVASACVDFDTARAGVNELRRIIRAYLGLPPPT